LGTPGVNNKLTDQFHIDGTSGQDVYVGKASNKKRYLVGAGILLLVTVVAYFSHSLLSGFLIADNFYERNKMRTATVVRGDYERSISVEGNVVATFNPMLYAQAVGEIFLLVEEGDVVVKDQELAVIENPELQNQIKREQAAQQLLNVELDTLENQVKQRQLEADQSLTLLTINLDAERREMERMAKIVSDGSISINEFEKSKDRVHALEVQVNNSTQQNQLTRENHVFEVRTKKLTIDQQDLLVSDLQRQIDDLTLTSPVDGIVGDIKVNEQDTVVRNQAILNVVDLTSYEIEVLIPETYAESLQKGLPVKVKYRNQEHDAQLASISPQVSNGSVSARVTFSGTAPKGLRQNLRLNNKIILESKQNVLKVKRGPFVESHGGRGVYSLEGDLAHYRSIQIGSIGINEVEIVSGLKEGEAVIISNTAELLGADTVLITN
jgi:HlyD family secretion protein